MDKKTEEKLRKLDKDEAFLKILENVSSIEETIKVFMDNGVEITSDELREAIRSANTDTELSDKQLNDVSGGAPSMTLANYKWFKILLNKI